MITRFYYEGESEMSVLENLPSVLRVLVNTEQLSVRDLIMLVRSCLSLSDAVTILVEMSVSELCALEATRLSFWWRQRQLTGTMVTLPNWDEADLRANFETNRQEKLMMNPGAITCPPAIMTRATFSRYILTYYSDEWLRVFPKAALLVCTQPSVVHMLKPEHEFYREELPLEGVRRSVRLFIDEYLWLGQMWWVCYKYFARYPDEMASVLGLSSCWMDAYHPDRDDEAEEQFYEYFEMDFPPDWAPYQEEPDHTIQYGTGEGLMEVVYVEDVGYKWGRNLTQWYRDNP